MGKPGNIRCYTRCLRPPVLAVAAAGLATTTEDAALGSKYDSRMRAQADLGHSNAYALLKEGSASLALVRLHPAAQSQESFFSCLTAVT